MRNGLFATLGWIAHTCSDFGEYFMSFQRKCLKSGRAADCEGKPTLDDARKDYQATIRSKYSTFGP